MSAEPAAATELPVAPGVESVAPEDFGAEELGVQATDLLDLLPGGVLVLDEALRCRYANATARALLGRGAEDLRDRDFLAWFAAPERAAIAAGIALEREGGWSSVLGATDRAIEYVPRAYERDGRRFYLIALRDVTQGRHLARKAAALARVAAGMTYAGALAPTLDALAHSVVQATGMTACLVWILDESGSLRVAGGAGLPAGYAGALEGIVHSGVELASMRALAERRPLVFPNSRRALLADTEWAPLHPFLADVAWDTLACLPLLFHDRALGTMVGHYPGAALLDEAELTFLGAIADQAAVAVENARLAAAAQDAAAREERLRARTLVQEKEAQYRAIFEATSDGMVISDLNGNHLEVNKAYCAMHGYTREEMLRMHPSAYIHPSHHPALAAFLQAVKEGGTYRVRAIDLRKDGTPFHVEVFGTGFLHQGEPHVLGVVRDTTEQVEAYKLLEQRVVERTRELATVLEVSHNLASTLELQPLLGLILEHLREIVDYQEASVQILDGGDLTCLGYWGPYRTKAVVGQRLSLARAAVNRQVVESRESLIIPDIWDEADPWGRSFRKVGLEDLDNPLLGFNSWLGVPLIHKGQVIGMLGLLHTQPRYYTAGHARLALAIATQATVAIENARLYARAQEVAALEERARLARELHDSVSQALYGIALGARTARALLEKDARRAVEPLDYVLSLAEAGLAEMRSLIFALRPESLAREGLVAALSHQIAALRGRHELHVESVLGDEPDARYPLKEALYRIAQEALHNTVKHARARQVRVVLAEADRGVELLVEDDGVGFDPEGEFPGHLGLRSMRERVTALGGTLALVSAPGTGTRLRAWVPYQEIG